MVNLAIDAMKERGVYIFDVSGVYLNANMHPKKFVIVNSERRFAHLMRDINKTYKGGIVYLRKKPVLYLQETRAIMVA